jgi:pyruvate-ferredoxin/flavodoxin oxidoreductase
MTSATSLPYDPEFRWNRKNVVRAMFYGLGADGNGGANKNSIKMALREHRQLCSRLFRLRLEKSGG